MKRSPYTIDDAMQFLVNRSFPVDFNQWAMDYNNVGTTIAHQAAAYDLLPADFTQWGLADDNGWTVAHEASRSFTLPSCFDGWRLTDLKGTSVAETALVFGKLPDSFNEWDIEVVGSSLNLAHRGMLYSHTKFTPKKEHLKWLALPNRDGVTMISEIINTEFTEVIQEWIALIKTNWAHIDENVRKAIYLADSELAQQCTVASIMPDGISDICDTML
jgi:hypothetical protein